MNSYENVPLNPASYIDHTVLKETARLNDVDRICIEASEEGFAAVCVRPKYIAVCKNILFGSDVKVATVVAFPMGVGAIDMKVREIDAALEAGADEVDMVIDICALKADNWNYLEEEIKACIKPVAEAGKVIKVIVESGILTDKELLGCCTLYGGYGINYMKTSTGFAEFGASVHAVKLMRANLPPEIGIKASGGIRTYKFAKELIIAGATRLGCSASIEIMKEFKGQLVG